jgi:aspartyl-tRNA(Asn)/glutamyl-tRNA(Gln) amidotransferase subunit C
MVDRELILKLESLSQLELSEEERKSMQVDLENMIQMVNKLQEIDTDGLEPLVHLGADESLLREDIIRGQLSRQEALTNAALHDEKYFLVPKVIEK